MISAQKVCSFMYVYSNMSFWGFWGLKKDLENWLEFSSFVYELTVSISDAMITAYSDTFLVVVSLFQIIQKKSLAEKGKGDFPCDTYR